MRADKYELIRSQQMALIRALCTDDSTFPSGFDGHRLAQVKRALINKRARMCAQICPPLSLIGDRYDILFHQYAASNPLRDPSPELDAREFTHFLLKHNEHVDARLLCWLVREEAAHSPGAVCVRYCESKSDRALCLRFGNCLVEFAVARAELV